MRDKHQSSKAAIIIAKYAKNTQNSKIVISLQHLKKREGGMKIIFLHTINIKLHLMITFVSELGSALL